MAQLVCGETGEEESRRHRACDPIGLSALVLDQLGEHGVGQRPSDQCRDHDDAPVQADSHTPDAPDQYAVHVCSLVAGPARDQGSKVPSGGDSAVSPAPNISGGATVSARIPALLTFETIPSYSFRMPRRKAGELIPIEVDILVEAMRLTSVGQHEFHGFGLAKELRDGRQTQGLIGHGTLYKALGRLEQAGLLESRLEDADVAAEQGRPRRRLYRITDPGRLAAARALDERPRDEQSGWYPGIEPA